MLPQVSTAPELRRVAAGANPALLHQRMNGSGRVGPPASLIAAPQPQAQGGDTRQREASADSKKSYASTIPCDVDMNEADRQQMEQRRSTWRFSKIAKDVPGGGAGPATMAVGAAELQPELQAELQPELIESGPIESGSNYSD